MPAGSNLFQDGGHDFQPTLGSLVARGRKGRRKVAGLDAGQFLFQRDAGIGQRQLLDPAVMLGQVYADQRRGDQLAQWPVECLFRYAEDAEQGIDRCFRAAPDKLQYPVMYPTQATLRQQLIRLRGKSTVGEEELLGGVAQSIDVI